MARDGVDTDCDGLDVLAFVHEDFEGGVYGDPVAGTGCWTCAGTCDETLNDALSQGGAGSLYATGSNSALLFCSDDGLSTDFAFESWFWDDGSSDLEHRVLFQEEADMDARPAVFVGFNTVACDPPEYYCSQQLGVGLSLSEPVVLEPRSEGWHRISATASYTSADAIAWALCVSGGETGVDEEVCASLNSEAYAIGPFRLHHDEFTT